MKNSFLRSWATATCAATMLLSMSSCTKDAVTDSLDGDQASKLAGKGVQAIITLPNVIDASTPGVVAGVYSLTAANTYLVDGKVYVKGGVNLSIAAGTRLEGVIKANPIDASALVITKGSKITAIGTASSPVIMTGHIDALNPSLSAGDWGGLVVLGKATTNHTALATIEGIDASTTFPAGVTLADVQYGGSVANGINPTANDADNSGQLSYVRVEYAGAAISLNNELNGFTFGAVGNGTTLDHLQAYRGADDGFEFFGGTVNAKYLIATSSNDDSFDFDNGYSGKIQFGVSALNPTTVYGSGTNGIESDNDALSSSNLPITNPVMSNFTIVGTSTGTSSGAGSVLLHGALMRRNTSGTVRNSVIYGWKGTTTINSVINATGANAGLTYTYNVLGTITGSVAWLPGTLPATNNSVLTTALTLSGPFTTAAYFSTGRSLRPLTTVATTDADTGANFTGLPAGSGVNATFTSTTYRGAFPVTNTTSGTTYWINETWVNKVF
jgi:hypothetical protein